LLPGATLVLTDAPILPKTTGQPMTVITAEDAPPLDPCHPSTCHQATRRHRHRSTALSHPSPIRQIKQIVIVW
jgi:hypothetical protein